MNTEMERQAFEAHMRLGGYSNPEKHQDGSYVSSAMELWWQGWKARATHPAQTEQQPVGHQFQDREGVWKQFMSERHYEDTLADGTWPIRAIYAAPIAQTAPQPEQSGLVEAAGAVIRAADWWSENEDSPKSALIHFARATDALRAALSAQGESHE